MWFNKKSRPTAEELAPRHDIDEAIAVREETRTDLVDVRGQAPLVRKMTAVLIDREGKNHYMETLYNYVPREAS